MTKSEQEKKEKVVIAEKEQVEAPVEEEKDEKTVVQEIAVTKITPDITKRLEAPFEKIRWRIQSSVKGRKDPEKLYGIYMAYIDQRDVTDRLNEVVGADNWEFAWQEIQVSTESYIEPEIEGTWKNVPEKKIVKTKYAVKGILTVMGNTKEDVGYAVMEEDKAPLKSAVSDALKRCGVQFGIGKFLYSLGTQVIELDPKTKKPKDASHIEKLENMFNTSPRVVADQDL